MMPAEPSLFSLLTDDWKNLASFFVTPAIGISVAYLLGADLLKVPFIATDVPYKIPGRILAIFAFALCLLASFSAAAWLTLRVYPGPLPNVDNFNQTFFRPLNDQETSWLQNITVEPVADAYLILDEFYNRSDLRIFVNNSRVFASYRECAWQFQCKNDDQSVEQERVSGLVDHMVDSNLYPTNHLNKLPLSIRIFQHLRPGQNYIDVFSNNSGLGSCHVKARIVFSLLSGKDESVSFEIKDGAAIVNSFRTISQSGSFRTCDQFRLPAAISLAH